MRRTVQTIAESDTYLGTGLRIRARRIMARRYGIYYSPRVLTSA